MKKNKNDLAAKITVLIVAIFLWSFVMDDVNPEITRIYRNVTVNYSNTSALDREGLVVMEPQSLVVDVKVTGKKSDLARFDRYSASNILAQVDLSGYSEGQVKVPITVSLVDQPSGISITSVEPREALFTFDKLITKEVPVTIERIGSLPENYVLGNLVSNTKNISISGPRTWVNQVDKIVATINIDGRTSTDTESFSTVLLDGAGNEVRGITKDPNTVQITVPVYRAVTLPIELQTTNELPEDYSITDISITPSSVTVRGDESVANLTKVNTQTIDINQLLGGTALEVELDLPEGVQLVDPNQKITIVYDIEQTGTKSFTVPVREVDIQNLASNLVIDEESLDQQITVTLTGYMSILDTLESEDLEISMNLQGLTEGIHEVLIEINEIDGVSIESLETISINLKTP